MKNNDYYKAELNKIDEVPTLPQVAFKLIAMISDEKSSMREIGNLIEEDPPLVAKILRIINSGYFNLRNQVKDIRQATVLIGLDEIRNLVFAMSVFSTFYHVKENEYFNFLGFWKHSAAAGKVATILGKYLDLHLGHTAFIAGLLHDFGRLVLQLYFHDDYENVFEYSIEHNTILYQAEKESLNFTHSDAGYWLAKKWNLPEEIQDVILRHHEVGPESLETEPLPALIHLGDRIANIWGIGIEPNPVMDVIEDNSVWQALVHKYPRMENFPLDEMTRVFDMHLEEAEDFIDQVSKYQELAEI